MSESGVTLRSLFKLSEVTHAITLPKPWVVKNKLKKKDKVAVYYDNIILIAKSEEDLEEFIEDIIKEKAIKELEVSTE